MNCQEFAAVQTALVEDCLADEVRLHAEAHAAVCLGCGARLEREIALKATVARAVGTAPDDLRRAVVAAIGPPRPARRSLVAAMVAVTAVLVLAASVALHHTGPGGRPALVQVLDDYEDHRHDVRALPVPAGVPDLTTSGLGRWGIGEVHLPSGAARVMRYAGPAGTVAVYRLTASLDRPAGARATDRGWAFTDDEYTMLAWPEPPVTVLLVGSLSEPDLARLAPSFGFGT